MEASAESRVGGGKGGILEKEKNGKSSWFARLQHFTFTKTGERVDFADPPARQDDELGRQLSKKTEIQGKSDFTIEAKTSVEEGGECSCCGFARRVGIGTLRPGGALTVRRPEKTFGLE